MIVEIISIGDELLIGQTVNTNASWMGEKLSLLGADVKYCTVIKDQKEDIVKAIDYALGRVDVVLITGGLGPTKDDITKHVLCEYFGAKLILNEDVLRHVESFFVKRKRKMLDVNIQQAYVPDNCAVLHNENGTAPGMWFEKKSKILVSMPGVPYEMKSIMTSSVLGKLKAKFDPRSLYFRTIQTQGIGESFIADRILNLEMEIRANGISLAYLPSPGGVRLRLSSEDTAKYRGVIKGYMDRIEEELPTYVFGYDNATLEEVVGNLLKESNQTLGTIESCTGGALAASITSVSGSSSYFIGSVISYANEVKINNVGVNANTIKVNGVVSKEVVEEMANKGREKLGTDYAVALSGVAGPSGGSEDKPVGTVWIGIAGPERVISNKFQFEQDRSRNIRRSVLTALNLLRCELMGINIEKS